MSELWAYNPDVCDGDFCPRHCENCPKMEKATGIYHIEEDEDD